jgi:hypothetical protein
MSFWHFAFAVLKRGDEGSIPAPNWKPPLGLGSGKLGMPLERMHWAYFSKLCCSCAWLGAGPELAAPLVAFVLLAGLLDVVVVSMLAIEGDFEPPQPAASRARLASPMARATPRRVTAARFTP